MRQIFIFSRWINNQCLPLNFQLKKLTCVFRCAFIFSLSDLRRSCSHWWYFSREFFASFFFSWYRLIIAFIRRSWSLRRRVDEATDDADEPKEGILVIDKPSGVNLAGGLTWGELQLFYFHSKSESGNAKSELILRNSYK